MNTSYTDTLQFLIPLIAVILFVFAVILYGKGKKRASYRHSSFHEGYSSNMPHPSVIASAIEELMRKEFSIPTVEALINQQFDWSGLAVQRRVCSMAVIRPTTKEKSAVVLTAAFNSHEGVTFCLMTTHDCEAFCMEFAHSLTYALRKFGRPVEVIKAAPIYAEQEAHA